MIQRLDCSKCGINQTDTDKPFVALPILFICQNCFTQQISAEDENTRLNKIISDIEDWGVVICDEPLLKLIKALKAGKRRI